LLERLGGGEGEAFLLQRAGDRRELASALFVEERAAQLLELGAFDVVLAGAREAAFVDREVNVERARCVHHAARAVLDRDAARDARLVRRLVLREANVAVDAQNARLAQ